MLSFHVFHKIWSRFGGKFALGALVGFFFRVTVVSSQMHFHCSFIKGSMTTFVAQKLLLFILDQSSPPHCQRCKFSAIIDIQQSWLFNLLHHSSIYDIINQPPFFLESSRYFVFQHQEQWMMRRNRRCLMLESRSQEEMFRLLLAVCPGGWQTWNLSNLLQSLEVGSVYMMSSLENKCTILLSMAWPLKQSKGQMDLCD